MNYMTPFRIQAGAIFLLIFRGSYNLASALALVLGVLGIGAWDYFKSNGLTLVEKILGIAIIFLSLIFVNVIRNAMDLIINPSISRFKAKRIVPGEGLHRGEHILVFRTIKVLSRGDLLTLFSSSAGAKCPIALLKVVYSDTEDTQAQVVASVGDTYDIQAFFNDEARRNGLFAEPAISDQWIG
ncbi:MAG TPA: hypothetical protein VFM16_07435, partial [Holophagaceae bacterium]|nr:hypothetical protein [Holophagaceae bacterium]